MPLFSNDRAQETSGELRHGYPALKLQRDLFNLPSARKIFDKETSSFVTLVYSND